MISLSVRVAQLELVGFAADFANREALFIEFQFLVNYLRQVDVGLLAQTNEINRDIRDFIFKICSSLSITQQIIYPIIRFPLNELNEFAQFTGEGQSQIPN